MAAPERDELYDFLGPRDAKALYNSEVMRAEIGIPADVYDEADSYVSGDLMSSIPMEGTKGLRAEAIAFGRNDALNQYGPQNYRNNASDPITPNQYRIPAELSEVPTATSDPTRPRTVAAGYDPSRAVLTLIFRDGTFYNYYEVTPRTWTTFRNLSTKGQFIADTLDSHPRGPADVSQVRPEVRQALYQVARTAQTRYGGRKAPSTGKAKQANTPRSSQGRAPKPPKPKRK
jgi:hypothetical protein